MLKPTATKTFDADGIHVTVTWSGVPLDRPIGYGWLLGAKDELTADRLTAAVNAGVVFKNPTVMKDVNGKTYVSADTTQFFHKRHMKKSLTAVGF